MTCFFSLGRQPGGFPVGFPLQPSTRGFSKIGTPSIAWACGLRVLGSNPEADQETSSPRTTSSMSYPPEPAAGCHVGFWLAIAANRAEFVHREWQKARRSSNEACCLHCLQWFALLPFHFCFSPWAQKLSAATSRLNEICLSRPISGLIGAFLDGAVLKQSRCKCGTHILFKHNHSQMAGVDSKPTRLKASLHPIYARMLPICSAATGFCSPLGSSG